MWGLLLSIPVMLGMLMLQVGIVSRLPLLHGTGDLVLLALIAWAVNHRVKMAWFWAVVGGLFVTYISALPAFSPLVVYLMVVIICRLMLRRIWQTPILLLFVMTFAGTILQHLVYIAVLTLAGTPLDITQSISQVVFPSVLVNLLLILPVYSLMNDLANWVYPVELEA